MTEIKLKKGESVEKALRRLKKKIDREGILKEVRNHRHYEKPSERRRRKMKMARFSAMLSARYADLLIIESPGPSAVQLANALGLFYAFAFHLLEFTPPHGRPRHASRDS